MDTVELGRTGLRVSVMGLGCGGHSRLGLAAAKGRQNAVAIVRRALDLGVNIIDTAESYGTEEAVGLALEGVPRDSVVISTKASSDWHGRLSTGEEMRERAHACLRRLRTDFVDVFHLHALAEPDYDYAVSELVPALRSLRDEGKIRFLGVTERYGREPDHRTLVRALADPWFEVAMVGFSVINQSARARVLPETRRLGIGTLCMFAVRRALSRPDALREVMALLVERGQADADDFCADNPLGFLTDGPASSIPEAAYRFARWEPGLDVILSGTGSIEHLEENARSLMGPPLPEDTARRLRRIFARADSVSGN